MENAVFVLIVTGGVLFFIIVAIGSLVDIASSLRRRKDDR